MAQGLNMAFMKENGGGRMVLPSILELYLKPFSPHTVLFRVGGGEPI